MAVCVASCAQAAAKTCYVDAANGNDEWNGLSEVSNGVDEATGLVNGPRRTLVKALELAVSGDTVLALPGVYSNGVNEAHSARAFVETGVSLISRDGRDKTFIVGQTSPTPLRCLVINKRGFCAGFTLTGGKAPEDSNGGGASGISSVYGTIADCIVTNCVANRGGGGYQVNAINSIFTDCTSDQPGSVLYASKAWNCIFRGNSGTQKVRTCSIWNCTVWQNDSVYESSCYNCLILGSDAGSVKAYTTFFAGTEGAGSTWDDACHGSYLSNMGIDAHSMPFKASNLGIGAATVDYYDNCTDYPTTPAAIAAYKDKDAYGRPRKVDGRLDLGAVTYLNDRYVDATLGSDANDGLLPDRPKATLAAVLSESQSGDTVHAAAGVYAEGKTDDTNLGPSRAVVPAGVRLLADEGPEKTLIVGEKANTETGCGEGAVRGVRLFSGSILEGFTVTGGRTIDGAAGNNANGGGIYGTISGSLAVNCIVTNNVAGYRGNEVSYGTYVRCYLKDKDVKASDNYIAYNDLTLINCYVCKDDGDAAGSCSHSLKAYNTTFVNAYPSGTENKPTKAYNCLILNAKCGSAAIYRCLGNVPSTSPSFDDGSDLTRTDLTRRFDWATARPTRPTSGLVGTGNDAYYVQATNGLPVAFQPYLGLDYCGGNRLMGEHIDIGAGEYQYDAVLPGLMLLFR